MENKGKYAHVAFTLRSTDCPQIKINNIDVPVENQFKYPGPYLDWRLTWFRHIVVKFAAIKLKSTQVHWIIGPNSKLDLEYKVLLYNCIIKPIGAVLTRLTF